MEYHPPGRIMGLNNVSMPHTLNRISLTCDIGMSKDGIGRIIRIRPPDSVTPGYGFRMRVFRSSLGTHQIVKPVFLVNVWSLGITSTGAIPYFSAFCQEFTAFKV